MVFSATACEVSITPPEGPLYQGDGLVVLAITCHNPTASTVVLHDIRKGCGCQSIDLPRRDIAAGATVTGTVVIALDSAFVGSKSGSLTLWWSPRPEGAAGGATVAAGMSTVVARYDLVVRPVLSVDQQGLRLGDQDGSARITLVDADDRVVAATVPPDSAAAVAVESWDAGQVRIRAVGTPFSSAAVLVDVVRHEAPATPSRIRVAVHPQRALAAVVRSPAAATVVQANPLHPSAPLMPAAAAEAWYAAHGIQLPHRARYPLGGRMGVDRVIYSDRDGVDIGFVDSEPGAAARSVPVRLAYFVDLAPAAASTAGAQP